MNKIRTLDDFFNEIDEMKIYDKDYDVIMNLINTVDDALFVKILETVLDGDLGFHDFERVFENTDYTKYLEMNLDSQEKIKFEVENLIKLKQELNHDIPNDFKESNNIGLIYSGDEKYKDFYLSEISNIQDNLIYSIFNRKSTEGLVSRQTRLNLLKYIEAYRQFPDKLNGENNISFVDENGDFINYPALNPEDILFSADRLMIPISPEKQILDSSDEDFMIRNNIDEFTMKKIKGFTEFLRRKETIENG